MTLIEIKYIVLSYLLEHWGSIMPKWDIVETSDSYVLETAIYSPRISKIEFNQAIDRRNFLLERMVGRAVLSWKLKAIDGVETMPLVSMLDISVNAKEEIHVTKRNNP